MNKDTQIVTHRQQRLNELLKKAPVNRAFPLIREVSVLPRLFASLQEAVGQYLAASLKEGGHNISFSNYEEMVQKYKNELMALPNVTPNGVLRPKLETYLEFNLVHSRLADIIQTFGIDEQVKKMRLPMMIRMVDGSAPKWVEDRPKANNKMHSDFWTGGCCDVAAICPLFGDLENSGLKFGEPVGIKDNFLSELTDYSQGADLYGDFKEYQLVPQKGNIYFQDVYCLHGTWRNGGGLRVSMDWTIQTVNYPEIEKLHSSKVLATDNHFDMKTWYSMGKRFLYCDPQTIGDCRENLAEISKEREVKIGSTIAGQTATAGRFIDVTASNASLPIARM